MPDTPEKTCPLPRDGVVERYFLEHRAKLLDVAAFLDRLDRSEAPTDADEDFRVEAMQRAIQLLVDEKGERAKRILELFSDPTTDPIPAAPMKGATGAFKKPNP
ncbi:MAG: hypothetical protein AAGA29_03585 [Planctomycetota bacterium]